MNNTAIDYARYDHIRPIRWTGDALELLDQRKLPFVVEHVQCHASDAVAEAIHALTVRGAPAIGIAAAWGVVLAARQVQARDGAAASALLEPSLVRLNAARPTAVNLAWALARMRRVLAGAGQDWKQALALEAQAIADEDLAANRHMGALGAGLTVWELQQDGIDATLIADSAASHLMKTGAVQWVIVGADRICANGDTANKIGTYQLAIAARHHGVKFMVVAPSSTVDMSTAHGDEIEIEQRDPGELFGVGGVRTVAEGIAAWNPVFDVTPGDFIDAIVTEKGVILNPTVDSMKTAFAS